MDRNEEILLILTEECAEVIQAVSKVKRFGAANNMDQLKLELGDVLCMIDLCFEYGVVPATKEEIVDRIQEKRKKLEKFSSIFSNDERNS